MQLFSDRLYRDLILLIIGLAGAGWFFYDLSEHHPMGSLQIPLSQDKIVSRLDSTIEKWKIEDDYEIQLLTLESYRSVLDSVKASENSPEMYKTPAFHWSVREARVDSEDVSLRTNIRSDMYGDILEIQTSDNLLKGDDATNPEAIRYALDQLEGSAGLTEVQRDSLASALIDFQSLRVNNFGRYSQYLEKLNYNQGGPARFRSFFSDLARHYADYYLAQSGWKDFEFRVDTLSLNENSDYRYSALTLTGKIGSYGATPVIDMEILPAGSVRSIRLRSSENTGDNNVVEIFEVRLLVGLLFIIWLLTIFYLRIKAKAVDTQPALIIAVLIGFLVPALFALFFVKETGQFFLFEFGQLVILFILMGVTGAAGAVTFFVLTAVSDSVTRQYWSEKLNSWDLIRSGMFRNKPTGWALINAMAIGGILILLWMIMIDVLPIQSVGMESGLLNDSFMFPSIATVVASVLAGLTMVLSLFLILSNQVFGLTGKKWIIPLLSAVLFGLFNINPIPVEPAYLGIVINVLLGLMLGLFYIQYDFLAVAGGYFFYFGLMMSSSGWLIGNSPDVNVFYLFMMICTGTVIAGLYFITKGTESDNLPEYIPSYIEDQAKEQRVRQELAIARIVQDTFLPSKFQQMRGLDIAGVCKPAMDAGGDYYDMIPLGDNRTAVAIGDVSGKGIKAAFYMTFTKGVLHSLSALILSPLELLNQLNRLFNENATRGTFISMIYGILEADRRMFTFARAGHNPMLIVHDDGTTEWLNSRGIGIGVSKDGKFKQYTDEIEYKIKEGDIIVLYTDGITEMMSISGDFYGEDRLEELVIRQSDRSSEEIMDNIIQDVRTFKGSAKQHDDMTLVIIKADARVEPED